MQQWISNHLAHHHHLQEVDHLSISKALLSLASNMHYQHCNISIMSPLQSRIARLSMRILLVHVKNFFSQKLPLISTIKISSVLFDLRKKFEIGF